MRFGLEQVGHPAEHIAEIRANAGVDGEREAVRSVACNVKENEQIAQKNSPESRPTCPANVVPLKRVVPFRLKSRLTEF